MKLDPHANLFTQEAVIDTAKSVLVLTLPQLNFRLTHDFGFSTKKPAANLIDIAKYTQLVVGDLHSTIILGHRKLLRKGVTWDALDRFGLKKVILANKIEIKHAESIIFVSPFINYTLLRAILSIKKNSNTNISGFSYRGKAVLEPISDIDTYLSITERYITAFNKYTISPRSINTTSQSLANLIFERFVSKIIEHPCKIIIASSDHPHFYNSLFSRLTSKIALVLDVRKITRGIFVPPPENTQLVILKGMSVLPSSRQMAIYNHFASESSSNQPFMIWDPDSDFEGPSNDQSITTTIELFLDDSYSRCLIFLFRLLSHSNIATRIPDSFFSNESLCNFVASVSDDPISIDFTHFQKYQYSNPYLYPDFWYDTKFISDLDSRNPLRTPISLTPTANAMHVEILRKEAGKYLRRMIQNKCINQKLFLQLIKKYHKNHYKHYELFERTDIIKEILRLFDYPSEYAEQFKGDRNATKWHHKNLVNNWRQP
jgi:hypothetical protein